MIFEVCVDSVAGVAVAASCGADRVELCAGLLEGGITPSLGMIRRARQVPGIGLHVMIRPRGGDFLYDADEVAAMEADVLAARAEAADGIVLGLLDATGHVRREEVARLVALARPMSVTFHRAFDMTPDPQAALETLIGLGIDRVLTSGQEASALEGLPLLAALVRQAAGRIVVMPGGGITPRNVARIAAGSGAEEIHFAALAPVDSAMQFRREHVAMGGALQPPEYARPVTSPALVQGVIAAAG